MSESKGLWFLVGLSLGAVAGIMYAPQSGEETRDLLSRKADEGRDLVQRKANDLREQASGLREHASHLRDQVGNLRDQVGNVREQAGQYAEKGKQAVTRQIDQFQAAVDAGKQAYRESVGSDRPDRGPETASR